MFTVVFSWDNLPQGQITNGIEEKVIYLRRIADGNNEITFRVEGLESASEVEVCDESGLVYTPTRAYKTLQPDNPSGGHWLGTDYSQQEFTDFVEQWMKESGVESGETENE